ncbi:MAG: NAD-dependent epimerase/dehydratase family protein [Hyphomicrobiaceae bacterium]
MRAKKVLITGGAGFVGCNATRYFGNRNWDVTVADNLSRKGTDQNLNWLRSDKGTAFQFDLVDVREKEAVVRLFSQTRFDAVIHLAAQVAVTTSVVDPRADFMINALGTFNVLDAVRLHCPDAVVILASTNKVYGKVTGARTQLDGPRYGYADRPFGIDENEPLDFLSPYGCSKGAADQYTLDFARIYGIPATSFRQSCIYGPRQFGVEDQGWVAWFAIAALLDRDITIYGDGKQIRDVLHVDDLLRAYEAAILAPDKIAGQAFNIGGGPKRILSLRDLISMLERRFGKKIPLKWQDWRPGDQRAYVSDIRKLETALSWAPHIDVDSGVGQLVDWVTENRAVFESLTEPRKSGATG